MQFERPVEPAEVWRAPAKGQSTPFVSVGSFAGVDSRVIGELPGAMGVSLLVSLLVCCEALAALW